MTFFSLNLKLDEPYCSDIDLISASGFDNEEYNTDFRLNKDEAFQPKIVVNNHPVFENGDGLCIWWHEYRNYWMGKETPQLHFHFLHLFLIIGSCENVGQNNGYAYLPGDFSCPVVPYGENGSWRRGGSNAYLSGVTTFLAFAFDGSETEQVSASGFVGFSRLNGKYRKTCTWKYTQFGFRCVQK